MSKINRVTNSRSPEREALKQGVREPLFRPHMACAGSGSRSWTIVVTTRSMYPTIPEGSRVTIEPASASELREGEVIAFRRPSRSGEQEIVVRRYRGCVEQAGVRMVVTRGDACGCDDPRAPAADVVGRVVAVRAPSVWYRCGRLGWWLVREASVVAAVAVRPPAGWLVRRCMRVEQTRDAVGTVRLTAIVAGCWLGRAALVERPEWAGETVELNGLSVRRPARRMGVGRALVRRAVALTGKQRRLVLCVGEENTGAIRLYEQEGFVRVAAGDVGRGMADDVRAASGRCVMHTRGGAL